jgi:hypothetical protein
MGNRRTSAKSALARLISTAVLLASVLVVTPAAPAGAAAGFGDVSDGAFYTESVQWMVDNAITTGTAPGCFSPARELTRAELAVFLWRYAGEPDGGEEPFSDVGPNDYFSAAVAWMIDDGVTTGTSPTTFHPSRTISRAEVATFLWRFMGEPAGESEPFVDVVSGHFYSEAVAWMANANITTGTSPTTFHPSRPVTRAEAATFLWRVADRPATNIAPGGDCGGPAEDPVPPAASFADSFDGNGALEGYVTNNPSVLPDVTQTNGRYRAVLTDNQDNKTLHFHEDQGRLDARVVEFPFDYVARNIGIGTVSDSQSAPQPNGSSAYVFAGVQVHSLNLEERTSSHVVIGHRGGAHFTVEGKNTNNGSSSVNDDGFGVAPLGRVDLRIVGSADGTLTVYYQQPNAAPGSTADTWELYRGNGQLPGAAPDYGDSVYIGLITYAFGNNLIPFVGTVDAVEDYSGNS